MGVVVSGALQFLVLYVAQHMLGYRHKAIFKPTDKHIKYMIYISVPIIIGTSVDQLNSIIDKSIASSVAVGGIAILNYAAKISDSILNIFVTSIATVLFPSLSEVAASGDIPKLRRLSTEAVRYVSILIIPAVVGIMIYAEEIVTIFYGRGQFAQSALDLTTWSLVFYAFGSFAFGLRQIIIRMFYALHDTKTPVYSSIVAVVLNIILNLTLSKIIGIPGLALATSISAYVSVFILFYFASKKVGDLGLKSAFTVILKCIIAAIVMAVVSLICYEFLANYIPRVTALAVAIALAVLIYASIMLQMKIEEVDTIKEKIFSKLNRPKAK